jgi:pilus assembly protein CpaE
MTLSARTILLTTDDSVANALHEAFGGDSVLAPIGTVSSMDELETMLSLRPSGLVIVDVQEDPDGMLGALAELIPTKPMCRFVVVADSFDKRLLLESMQAGARHYLPKDWIGADVVPICRELAEQVGDEGAGESTGGRVCTVLSTSGGCGATTFAVNLAAELGELSGERALVVDFDLRFGGVATHLGVSGEYGLADLLAREGPMDSDLVRSTAVERGQWLDVLLSPATINFVEPAPLYLDELQATLGVFRHGYPWTLIDAPALPFEAASALAGYSDEIAIVLNLSVKDLRNTRLLLDGLSRAGVDKPIHLFANRVKGSGKPITLKDAAETLEFDGDLRWLIEDEAGATLALHAGEPLLKAAPKSKLRRQLRAFAEELRGPAENDAGDEATPAQKKRSLLGERGRQGKKAA